MYKKLEQVKEILSTYNQEHLIYFYDELNDNQKEKLLDQIIKIDFKEIITLYNNSMKNEPFIKSSISPLNHIEKDKLSNDEINMFTKIGDTIISSNSFAVVTMAGGQGTRLGYKGPKGTYELHTKPYKKSLFEIQCENIKETNNRYKITIPWYIMTSEENNEQTQKYFSEHNYFSYPKNKIKFFIQDKLPLITTNGKLILQEPYLIKEAANVNGNVFSSMKNHNIIADLENNNIKWISFGGIDNVLLKNVDSLLLGLTVKNKYQIASKSIFKEDPLEKTAVYCKKYNKPAILDYDNIDLKLSMSKYKNGMYKYREANMLSHLMSIEAVKKVSNITLPYHRAFKKNAFVNSEGVKEVPSKPNSFKFENFIFDAFSYFDDMLLLRVNANEEFAPIKDFTGIYNPETALEKYIKFH